MAKIKEIIGHISRTNCFKIKITDLFNKDLSVQFYYSHCNGDDFTPAHEEFIIESIKDNKGFELFDLMERFDNRYAVDHLDMIEGFIKSTDYFSEI